MRIHWERLGILDPVYGLVGRGFGNDEIASQLNISEDNVRRCVTGLVRFGGHSSRAELVLEAFAAIPIDGEHRLAPGVRAVNPVSGDLRQAADQSKPHRGPL